jgi:hypothetical protein
MISDSKDRLLPNQPLFKANLDYFQLPLLLFSELKELIVSLVLGEALAPDLLQLGGSQ